ncbi:MAG TPA: thioredoxin family protein [Bryobacteraceae bacterium]|nr:thioredoxin family protein [Bryobacteraceae bacterium]
MPHAVVTEQEWLTARKALLAKEKELIHLRDRINRERQALPWVKVSKDYIFDTAAGKKTLAELFDGRSQLLVYHFMLGPGQKAGCPSCSLLADGFDGVLTHLENHDVAFVTVSRAPFPEINAYKTRMGWRFPWVSSAGSDFNFDYNVSFTTARTPDGHATYNYADMPLPAGSKDMEMPGLSAFSRNDQGEVFHTYSCYARGLEDMLGTMMFLDRAPQGRNEKTTMDFVRRHDEYARPRQSHSCCS